jgi:hypothetical protein
VVPEAGLAMRTRESNRIPVVQPEACRHTDRAIEVLNSEHMSNVIVPTECLFIVIGHGRAFRQKYEENKRVYRREKSLEADETEINKLRKNRSLSYRLLSKN